MGSSSNPNNPPPYTPTPTNFNESSQPQNKSIDSPMGSPHTPVPMINQQMINKPPHTMNQQHTSHMKMTTPQSAFAPQLYPYNADSLATDITQCKEPKLARCKSCNFIVMTRVEKKVSICQLIIVILMFCSIYLIVPSICVLIFCSDYEHFCTRCQSSIGRKKGCCC